MNRSALEGEVFGVWGHTHGLECVGVRARGWCLSETSLHRVSSMKSWWGVDQLGCLVFNLKLLEISYFLQTPLFWSKDL